MLNLALAATLPNAWFGDLAKSVKLKFEVMNALDHRYNTFEELSAGGLYNTANGTGSPPYANYVLAFPGAPRAFYGTISVKF